MHAVAGLSLMTGMPAASAARAAGRWWWFGVTMATKSMPSARARSASSIVATSGYARAASMR